MNAPPLLNKSLERQLIVSAQTGLSYSWNIPRRIAPLSPEEIHFLRSLSINDLMAIKPTHTENDVKSFFIQLLTGIATQIGGMITKELLTEISNASYQEPTHQKPKVTNKTPQIDKQIPENALTKTLIEAKHQNHVQSLPDNKLSSSLKQLANQEGLPTTFKSSDPSTIEKLAISQSSKTALKSGLFLLKDSLNRNGNEVAVDRAFQALGNGSSAAQAKAVYLDAKHAAKDFANNITTTFSNAIKAAVFANKVSEQGLTATTIEVAKDAVINTAAKFSAEGISKLITCENPMLLAGTLSTIIVNLLKPADIAPAWHDQPPLPLEVLNALKELPPVTHIPTLDPPYPSIKGSKP